MKVTKIGHCCLVIETNGVKILTDPGAYSDKQNNVKDINAVLITHEHPDHLHSESLKEVLSNNPKSVVITNDGVGAKLKELNISYTVVQGREKSEIRGVEVEAYDCKHEEIFEEYGQVQNTGYFIGQKLFYPGDSFFNPERLIDVLALPVAGPWCSLADAVHYAILVKPKKAFPVHDAALVPERSGIFTKIPSEVLPKHGIEFVSLKEGESSEF